MVHFDVKVTRIRTTIIRVEADSVADARSYVENYGAVEIQSDGNVIKEDDTAVIKYVKRST